MPEVAGGPPEDEAERGQAEVAGRVEGEARGLLREEVAEDAAWFLGERKRERERDGEREREPERKKKGEREREGAPRSFVDPSSSSSSINGTT